MRLLQSHVTEMISMLFTLCKQPLGAIAQLVERLLCKQDVWGSSPHSSTGSPTPILSGSQERLRNKTDCTGQNYTSLSPARKPVKSCAECSGRQYGKCVQEACLVCGGTPHCHGDWIVAAVKKQVAGFTFLRFTGFVIISNLLTTDNNLPQCLLSGS